MGELYCNDKRYNIVEQHLIGQGGNWEVWAIELSDVMQIGSEAIKNVVIKKPTNGNIDNCFQNWQMIKKANIPCVYFMLKGKWDNKDVIITENLNQRSSKLLYVSSNYHSSSLIINILLNKKNIICINENKLTNNRLNSIKNEEEIIRQLKQLARQCTNNHILLSNDVLFFGVDSENEKIVDFLCADFDIIIFCDDADLETQNQDAVNAMFSEFKMHYVRP